MMIDTEVICSVYGYNGISNKERRTLSGKRNGRKKEHEGQKSNSES